jgi:hypothetical protein
VAQIIVAFQPPRGTKDANLLGSPKPEEGKAGRFTYPGPSCLATIMLSLWDKYILPVEDLIKLALMGVNPGNQQNKRLREVPG